MSVGIHRVEEGGGGDRWQIVPALSECVLGQDGCDILGPTPPRYPTQSLVGHYSHNCQAVNDNNAAHEMKYWSKHPAMAALSIPPGYF